MSSNAMSVVSALGDQHGRHTHLRRRMFVAAAELLDRPDHTDVSVSQLAARAKVAPSVVSAHFPSLDALFAELYLHRVHALPLNVDPDADPQSRVSQQLRAITFVVADEPGLAAACNRALLQCDDSAVAEIRARIAAEVHRRVASAVGAGAWPEVVATLETVFWGALMQVHTHAVSYDGMAARMDTMLALILPEVASRPNGLP